jgi:hypothetical protein
MDARRTYDKNRSEAMRISFACLSQSWNSLLLAADSRDHINLGLDHGVVD